MVKCRIKNCGSMQDLYDTILNLAFNNDEKINKFSQNKCETKEYINNEDVEKSDLSDKINELITQVINLNKEVHNLNEKIMEIGFSDKY